MKNKYDTLKQWREERDEAAQSFDIQKFKEFYRKWQRLGVYSKRMNLPPDHILEISIRKMVVNLENPNPEKYEEAKEWLEARGYDLEIGGRQ